MRDASLSDICPHGRFLCTENESTSDFLVPIFRGMENKVSFPRHCRHLKYNEIYAYIYIFDTCIIFDTHIILINKNNL